MTTGVDDELDDDFSAGLASLRRWDVSPSRAERLRRRCHAILRAEPPAIQSAWLTDWPSFARVCVTALAAAWCLAYLAEIIRRTAAIFATP